MKPWTLYGNALASAAEILRQDAGPAPFKRLGEVMEWIARLPFLTVISTDLECERLSRALAEGRPEKFRQKLGENDLRWELILRCECAEGFCGGLLGGRRDFDWTQDAEQGFRHLLVEYWRPNALRWARKLSPEASAAYESVQPLVSDLAKMKKRLTKTNPAAN